MTLKAMSFLSPQRVQLSALFSVTDWAPHSGLFPFLLLSPSLPLSLSPFLLLSPSLSLSLPLSLSLSHTHTHTHLPETAGDRSWMSAGFSHGLAQKAALIGESREDNAL